MSQQLCVILFILTALSRTISEPIAPNECESLIYCKGNLLQRIQMSRVFADSKTFVDMPTKFSGQKAPFYFNFVGL